MFDLLNLLDRIKIFSIDENKKAICYIFLSFESNANQKNIIIPILLNALFKIYFGLFFDRILKNIFFL